MKTVVVYRSKTGFVKNYAEWIAEELKADLREATGVKVEDIMQYDAVVYGGGLYVGGINGVSLIKDNLDKLKGKRIAVFGSGASPVRQDVLEVVRDHNFTPRQLEQIHYFYLRGGFNYNKLPFDQKVLMTLLKWKIIWKKWRKVPLVGDEIGMLQAYSKPADFTNKKNITPLVAYIRGTDE